MAQVQTQHCLVFFRLVVTAVEKSTAVFQPRDTTKLEPFDLVLQYLTSFDLHDAICTPVGSAFLDAIRQQLAVVTKGHSTQCSGSIIAPGVWIQHQCWFSVDCISAIQNAMILQASFFEVKITLAILERRSVLVIVP